MLKHQSLKHRCTSREFKPHQRELQPERRVVTIVTCMSKPMFTFQSFQNGQDSFKVRVRLPYMCSDDGEEILVLTHTDEGTPHSFTHTIHFATSNTLTSSTRETGLCDISCIHSGCHIFLPTRMCVEGGEIRTRWIMISRFAYMGEGRKLPPNVPTPLPSQKSVNFPS